MATAETTQSTTQDANGTSAPPANGFHGARALRSSRDRARHQAARLTELAARKGWGGAELAAAANGGIDDEERRFSNHEVSVYLSGEDSPCADDLLRLIEATGPKDPLAAFAYVLGLRDNDEPLGIGEDAIVNAADAAIGVYNREDEENRLHDAQLDVMRTAASCAYYLRGTGVRLTCIDDLIRAVERRGYLRGRLDARFETWGMFSGAAEIDTPDDREVTR